MAYRATPLSNGHSPAELLMGRRLRTTIPIIPSSLQPGWTNIQQLRQEEKENKRRQQLNHNRRHKTYLLPRLNIGDHVWVSDAKERGTVLRTANTPKSFLIETPSGVLRRNRYHLTKTPVAPRILQYSPETPRDSTATEPPTAVHSAAGPVLVQHSSPEPRRYPERERTAPGYLKDFVTS